MTVLGEKKKEKDDKYLLKATPRQLCLFVELYLHVHGPNTHGPLDL